MQCLALCAVCLGNTAAQTPAPSGDTASLSGTVTNSVTGAPVSRAHVTIRTNGELQRIFGAMTDSQGKFTMTKAPPGHYTVSAEHLGFVMPSSQDRSLSDLTLAPGDTKENIKVALVPTGAISGRVLDAAGEPVQGVSVMAEGGSDTESDSTDDQGQFRIGGLHPGKYRVKAAPQNMQLPPEIRTDGTVDLHYSPTYYPDSLAKKQATRIDVPPASELTGIDIHLVRTPIVGVSGTVVGLPPGTKNVFINASRSSTLDNSSQSGTTLKADGSFALWRLDPGKYTLAAALYSNGPRNNWQSAPVEIEVTGVNIEHVELRMIPAFDIPVRLRFEDEQARQPPQPPTQPGKPQPPREARRISLRRSVGDPMSTEPADIGPDDSLTLEKVQPGLYHVELSWGPAYVKSIRIGSAETQGDVLDVRNGLAGPVVVVVSSNTCEVKGTVSDSSGPVAGARVLMRAVDAGAVESYMTTTSTGGAYSFPPVTPGKYKILATDDDAFAAFERSLDLEDYADAAESLDLQAGDKIVKDLTQRK